MRASSRIGSSKAKMGEAKSHGRAERVNSCHGHQRPLISVLAHLHGIPISRRARWHFGGCRAVALNTHLRLLIDHGSVNLWRPAGPRDARAMTQTSFSSNSSPSTSFPVVLDRKSRWNLEEGTVFLGESHLPRISEDGCFGVQVAGVHIFAGGSCQVTISQHIHLY